MLINLACSFMLLTQIYINYFYAPQSIIYIKIIFLELFCSSMSIQVLLSMGTFGWLENSEIVVVLEIEIAMVQPNANLLFRNSENNCCSAISRGRWNSAVFLNSLLLFQTNNPNNIPIIRNSITFLLSSL
jgi:hypothetical protein